MTKKDRSSLLRPFRPLSGSWLALLLAAGAPAQQTVRVSLDASGNEADDHSFNPRCSADGRFVVFESDATNLVLNDGNGRRDLFVKDLATGAIECVNVNLSGVPSASGAASGDISADGSLVVFRCADGDLVPNDTNLTSDIFLRDLGAGTTSRVSVDAAGNEADDGSVTARLSRNGAFVVFWTSASNLVPGDTNQLTDVYLKELATGYVERISIATNGAEPDGDATFCAVSDDGRYVAFDFWGSNLDPVDVNAHVDVYLRDRFAGTTVLVTADRKGNASNDACFVADISADGSVVAFASYASDLVASDSNFEPDAFVWIAGTGTVRVSVESDGDQSSGTAGDVAMSGDGRYVAFTSDAGDLYAADDNGTFDVFVHDRALGMTSAASVDDAWQVGDRGGWLGVGIGATGGAVAFQSSSTDLVAGDTNGKIDIFVRTRDLTEASRTNYGSGLAGTLGVPTIAAGSDPELHREVDLLLGSSAPVASPALLFFGLAPAHLPAWGGELLVQPWFTMLLALPASGLTLTGAVPPEEPLVGFDLYLQLLVLDPGAVRGIAFTDGLALTFGR